MSLPWSKEAKLERAKARRERDRQEREDFIRRATNTANGLTGTTHSGPGCDDALDPYEIRRIVREHLQNLSDREERGDV